MPVVTTTSVSGWKIHTGTKQEILDAMAGVGNPANVVCVFVDGASYSVLVKA